MFLAEKDHINVTDWIDSQQLYQTRLSPEHPQLRHLIGTNSSSFLFYANHCTISACDFSRFQHLTLVRLSFNAVCLAVNDSFLLVGGPTGQIGRICVGSMASASTDEIIRRLDLTSHKVEHEIVNAITLTGEAGDSLAYIASNAKKVVVLNVALLQRIREIVCEVEVNYAIASPHKDLLLHIGDIGRFFLSPLPSVVSKGDNVPAPGCRLRGVPDRVACFGAAFSFSGKFFAVASEGGMINVFEISTCPSAECPQKVCSKVSESHLVSSFSTTRAAQALDGSGPGSVRSLAFSPQPSNLLAWAEDTGVVGVVSTEDSCQRRQLITISWSHENLNNDLWRETGQSNTSSNDVPLDDESASPEGMEPRSRGVFAERQRQFERLFDFTSAARNFVTDQAAVSLRQSLNRGPMITSGIRSPIEMSVQAGAERQSLHSEDVQTQAGHGSGRLSIPTDTSGRAETIHSQLRNASTTPLRFRNEGLPAYLIGTSTNIARPQIANDSNMITFQEYIIRREALSSNSRLLPREELPRILGISWSLCGRFLYVAAENGIWRWCVNQDRIREHPDLGLI